jgi:hypothetical protein
MDKATISVKQPMDGHPNAKGAELIYRSSVNEILDLLKKHSL